MKENAGALPGVPVEIANLGNSGIAERRRLVVRDRVAWHALWTDVTAHQTAAEPPQVDFTKEIVVAASMGRRMTGGYSIHIDSAYNADGKLRVVVREVSPGVGCMLSQALTAPFVAARVTRHDGAVEFVERSETKNCG